MYKYRKVNISNGIVGFSFFLVINFNFVITAKAQFQPSDNMNPMDHGPFVTSTIAKDPNTVSSIIAYKGIAVKVGSDPQAVMTFDTDLLRMAGAWTGGFLHWYPARDGLEDWPGPDGLMHFETGKAPGWSLNGDFNDPRSWPYGPLPKGQVHYNGLYHHGNKTLFSYGVGHTDILELPAFKQVGNRSVFTRTFNLSPAGESLSLRVLQAPEGATLQEKVISGSKRYVQLRVGEKTRAVGMQGVPKEAKWRIEKGHLILDLPGNDHPLRFELAIGPVLAGEDAGHIVDWLKQRPAVPDLTQYQQPGPDQWETLEMEAVMGKEEGAFAVDELTLPNSNPWNSFIRLTDVDFLSDGRAVVSSLSGDVWLVEGIQNNLGTLRWHRFATGLFQPNGLKVVDDQIYVTGRDQITRLHDLNNDGMADFYENFNNQVMASTNFHAFNHNLETDAQGNFYFAKSTPWPPYIRGEGPPRNAEITPHHGVLFKLPPDGSDLEIVATGLRNPNGMAIGPDDEIIYSDNEGNWVPTSKVHRVKRGGFHGFIPSAHQENNEKPDSFEPPIIWTPHHIDNSPAKPMFITSEHWPDALQDNLLLASYGRANLSLVLKEEVDGVWQGAHINLPLRFKSGLERGRFHEDGHLYLAGMTSWQSIGEKWGSFHRVRYTGQPLNLPVEVNTQAGGLELVFSNALDPETAMDTGNYSLQQWTYPWTSKYGTSGQLYSVKDPGEKKRDLVEVRSVQLSDDGKSVLLQIPELRPGKVNTSLGIIDGLPDVIEASLGLVMSINYNLKMADGAEIDHMIHKTIHRVPSEGFEE